MLTPKTREILEKQGYKLVGEHSAVKTCGWTKNALRGTGGCYKLKFYGIKSHQCMQMTTSISCANRCSFCWRDYKAPVSKGWEWKFDDPDFIIENSLKAQEKLLEGFKGNPKTPRKLYEMSRNVAHVALSLTGEPIMYPKINEMVKKFHDRKISTFLVTNAQYPDAIKSLIPITQLYISLDAPNKELLKIIDKPLFSDYWERLNESLELMSQRDDRTAIRITCVKDLNMCGEEGYASLIKKADPDFIEIKGYMHVGAARDRLTLDNMPSSDEVREWALKVLEYLPDYEFTSEHDASRVVLLAKKKFGGKTWINFEKFFEDYPKMLTNWEKKNPLESVPKI